MYDINSLAMRVANCAKRKSNPNELLGLSDESLLELVRDAAAGETLPLSAEVNNTDVWTFASRANYNVSFNNTFAKVVELLFQDDVLNRAAELLKRRCEKIN